MIRRAVRGRVDHDLAGPALLLDLVPGLEAGPPRAAASVPAPDQVPDQDPGTTTTYLNMLQMQMILRVLYFNFKEADFYTVDTVLEEDEEIDGASF